MCIKYICTDFIFKAMHLYYHEYFFKPLPKNSKHNWINYGKHGLKSLLHFLKTGIKDEDAFLEFFDYQVIPKQTVIAKQGEVMNNVYFIINGSVKITRSNGEKEQIMSLLNGGNVIVSKNSFFLNMPSDYDIVATTDLRVFVLTKEKYNTLIKNSNWREGLGIALTRILNYSLEFQRMVTMALYLPAEERTNFIYERFPKMVEDFKLFKIANLFGMAPESISRAKAKMQLH